MQRVRDMRVDKGKGMKTRIRLVEKQKLEGERKKKEKNTKLHAIVKKLQENGNMEKEDKVWMQKTLNREKQIGWRRH